MRLRNFFLILLIVSLIDYCVPFIFLKDIAHFYAGYLFWCVLTLVVIGFAAVYTQNWRKNR